MEELPKFTDYSMKNHTYTNFNGEVLYPFGCELSYDNTIHEVSSKIPPFDSIDGFFITKTQFQRVHGIGVFFQRVHGMPIFLLFEDFRQDKTKKSTKKYLQKTQKIGIFHNYIIK